MNNQSISSIEMKKMNRNRIFKYVYHNNAVSKQNIADALNMSLPTVNQNIKTLKEQGLIIETGMLESTGGRKAKALSANTPARYAVGIDITRNHVVAAVIDIYGNILRTERVRALFEKNTDYFRYIGKTVELAIGEDIDRSKILGVGISVPSLLSADGRTVTYSTVLDFTDGSLSSFEEYIPYKCLLSNDANAAGIAELWNHESVDNVVYLSLSSSVGGAILLNNKFYPGENNRSAELGHITIIPGGTRCYCGQHGCVDAYCNSAVLTDTADGSLTEFFNLIKQGSAYHEQVWNTYMRHLSIVVNSLRMTFDCSVILGGQVGGCMDDYVAHFKGLAAKLNSFEANGEYVKVCKYKMEASAVGAALQHVQPFIDGI
ncbi:MAG: ROK family transcriptional regulator [Oscillospiraceae bacterium]|nr:ROK family transcriptional regulator [Oscillospiraceae bacterium]